MSSCALVFLFTMLLLTGMLFGGLVMKLFDDIREMHRLKKENKRLTEGTINQVDFISFLAAYEDRQRAELNRQNLIREWASTCEAEAAEDAVKKARSKQKKQISDQLAKATK